MNANLEILKKFIGEQNQRIQNDISKQGYKDDSPYKNNPFNIIQGTNQGTPITMKGVSTPLMGIDNFGNKQYMQPGQEYYYPGNQVKETCTAKYGGLLNKTITCSSCGWSWKAADGGNDISTCHKCGHENTIMQMGGNIYPINYVPKAQDGLWKENRKAFVDSTLNANKHLDFVKRLYDQSKGSIQIPGVPGRSTHYMADDKNRVYPTVVNKNGKLTYLSNPDEAWDYANDNKEYIDFKTPEQAAWFANSPNHSTGYKLGTNVLTEIPRRQMGGADMMYADRDYQNAGTVKYGTPEYAKAWKEGNIQMPNANGEEVPYWGGELDNITIQNNYKKPRGFWEQSRDQYLKEHKDDGLLGAIGSVVTYPLAVGQHALTYGLTGKVQNPSEAWGYNTNEKWFDSPSAFGKNLADTSLNLVADPANLIGAGILTKEKALSKLNNLRNINNEGKIFSGINNELNNMAIRNTENYMAKRSSSNLSLPKDLEPFISRIGESGISREEEVFRNAMGKDYKKAKELENTIFLDAQGNQISQPIKDEPLKDIDYIKNYKKNKNSKSIQPSKGNPFIPRSSSIIDINDITPIQRQGFPNPLGIVDKVVPRPPYPGMLVGMEGSWNNLSPLNLIPGYGEKLSAISSHPKFVGFRKFGNSIQDVIESQSLRPKGSGMGSSQIMGEGNWAEPGKVNENYSGLFEATMNPQIEGSNIKLERLNKRNGIVGTTKEGNVAIPLTDPGLSFNRRLPFSNRYVPIDKEKLINNQFQLATQLPYLQSLAEKYGLWAGAAGAAGYFANGKKGSQEYINALNKYTIDPIINYTKPQLKEANKKFQNLLNSTQYSQGGLVKHEIVGTTTKQNKALGWINS